MTPAQFQDVHGPWLKEIIGSEKGQALFKAMLSFQPSFPASDVPHLFAKGVGQREGFEMCLKAMVSLSNPPKIKQEVEATYGVPDAKK